MRDTIIHLGIIAAFFWFINARPGANQPLKQTTGDTNAQLSANEGLVAEDNGSQSATAKHQRSAEEVRKSGQKAPRFQTARSEFQGLSSIYRKKKVSNSKKSASGKRNKNLFGVPIEDWVLAQKDSLHGGSLPVHEKDGIRVFLMCSEITGKNRGQLSEGRCRSLARKSNYGGLRNAE